MSTNKEISLSLWSQLLSNLIEVQVYVNAGTFVMTHLAKQTGEVKFDCLKSDKVEEEDKEIR